MNKILATVLMLIGSVVMGGVESPSEFDKVFLSALRERDLTFRALSEERYEVETPSGVRDVYIGNIKRNFERDRDPGAVTRFLENILAVRSKESMGDWTEAKRHLFPLLESAEVVRGTGTVVQFKTESTRIALVFHVEGSGDLRFVRSSDLEHWGTSVETAWEAAFEQLNMRASRTEVTILDAGGLNLASISAEEPYKASLLLAPKLKSRIPPSLGWPLVAVAPARDFVYLLPKVDLKKATGLGAVVVREFKNSGYPISTEVWELSDSGLESIGEYPVK
jgi:hypothetical protein